MLAPRPYQAAALRNISESLKKNTRVIACAPCGSGKTILAACILRSMAARGRRGMFVAHRIELINQTYDKLLLAGLSELDIDVIRAGDRRRSSMARISLASIDTLRARGAYPEVDGVIVDECHRGAGSPTYLRLQEHYRPPVWHIGLTATPALANGSGLGPWYDDIVSVASPSELIALGNLVAPSVWTVPTSELPDMSQVKVRRGDYDAAQMAAAVEQGALVGNIVEHWQRRAGGARTLVFAASVAHSRMLSARFISAGVAAEHLDGSSPENVRAAVLSRLRSGATRVVCNCALFTEGFDLPAAKCVVLARPTKSLPLYIQMVGRGLRPWEGQSAILLDHSGAVLDHGLPHEDREWTLEGIKRRKKQGDPTCKTCPQCFAIVASAVQVCECGFAFGGEAATTAQLAELEERDGELVEVTAASMVDKRAKWDELCRTVVERGFKPGWAWHAYRSQFGVGPPNAWPRPAPTEGMSGSVAIDHGELLSELRRTAEERGYKPMWVNMQFKAKTGRWPGTVGT